MVFCARYHFLVMRSTKHLHKVYIEYCQAYPIKQLQLTPIAVKFPFNASTKTVRAELVANKVDETWANSTWAKRMAVKAKRAGLTDLDR